MDRKNGKCGFEWHCHVGASMIPHLQADVVA
jgi:hypothetical protein